LWKREKLKNSEKQLEAAIFKRNLAIQEIKVGNRSMAWKHLHELLTRLSMQSLDPEGDALFVTASLEFSNLSFVLGQGFSDVRIFLESTLIKAERLGDRRSRGLTNLHLGRLFYLSKQRAEALKIFMEGKAEVENLGDEDILFRAAEFIGLYYFIQGIFPEAKSHFERASQTFEPDDWTQVVVNPSAPMMLSYCCAFLGHFHEAIGILDYYRRLALDKSNESLATTFRAVLGIVLLMSKNKKESMFHLSGALDAAVSTGNALAKYFAKGGLSYYHFLERRFKESRDLLEQTISEGASSGLIVLYASPMFLEMIFEYHIQGMKPIKRFNYPRELCRILQEPNIHLRGTVLRLSALESVAKGENDSVVQSDLEQSEKYLMRSGDPIQLAKTQVEMARLNLRTGNEKDARALAQKAWKGFSGYGDLFYPDDLRHLLTIKTDLSFTKESQGGFFESFMIMVQELIPSTDLDELLTRIVTITNRLFGAERGSMFWLGNSGKKEDMEIRGACNLLKADVDSAEFRPNLALIFKASQERKPQIIRQEHSKHWSYQTKVILCIPIEIRGRVQCVLYHDNSYARDCFDLFNNQSLSLMAKFIAKYVENIISFNQRLERKVSANLSQIQQSNVQEILTVNGDMIRLLVQADRIATTDSNVLILGETGVGKELLAQRIHRKSLRNKHALIVVDISSLSENLIESDLFGHEKGAFTGADHLRVGRMELAHRGTLFIDEIGEIPRSVQVKLLRTLQEKTLCRVGGSKTISSDFRLVVATNRDLATEVRAGRFREDLFYRLNVVPLTLPPLRKRKEDLPLLARHYLNRYANMYNNHEVFVN
jgi:transcriptional regulator with GAF, ATPase, and Fis domain/tetratricopeptide (TPR) repeat protein